MHQMILGVGDFGVTNVKDYKLKALGLGSCVAVIIYDPMNHCIGMDHIALPESSIDKEQAAITPGHFADTGIPALLEAMRKVGSIVHPGTLIVKLVGGATLLNTSSTFNIGKRNVLAIKRTLWQHGMGAVAEDTGGRISRNVTAHAHDGKVYITSPGRVPFEI